MKRVYVMGLFLALTASAQAAEWKKLTCPSANAVLVGTGSSNRLELCIGNPDDTKTVCVGKTDTITCDGTVATDGFPFIPGLYSCDPPLGQVVPAKAPVYCRSETSPTVIGYKEVLQ